MTLRPHQITGTQFLLDHNRRTILADIAGTGKTKIVLDALFTNPKPFPVLIVCTKPGLIVWETELIKWYDEPSHIYAGTPKERKEKLQKFITTMDLNFLITTAKLYPEVLANIGPMFFKTLIIDEYHLFGLLNRKSKFHKFTKSVAKLIPYVIPLTGTPRRKSPADWFGPLSIIDPDVFTSYWRFVNEHCIIVQGQFGMSIENYAKDKKAFNKMLDNYRRRIVDDSYLPSRTRQPIAVEMTVKQQRLYDTLRKEMYLNEDGQFLITQNKLTNMLRCRQLMVSPKILGFNDNGGALNIVKELVIEELSEGNPCVVFTPFVPAVQLIKDELNNIKGIELYSVQGGMSYEEHKIIQNEFQNSKTKNKVLICVIKSGTTMTLTAAKVAIFIGYELGLHDNIQAEKRIHRETQTHPTRFYYILYKNSVDERGLEILNSKVESMELDISREDYYKALVDKSKEKC